MSIGADCLIPRKAGHGLSWIHSVARKPSAPRTWTYHLLDNLERGRTGGRSPHLLPSAWSIDAPGHTMAPTAPQCYRVSLFTAYGERRLDAFVGDVAGIVEACPARRAAVAVLSAWADCVVPRSWTVFTSSTR